ncbi:MAG: TonB-dependent receptor [Prevotella sp.]|nr:TonB-dependent receptor [Prevotella sp.]
MEKRLTMFFAVLLFGIGTVMAQVKVSGTVVESASNEPVVGAKVAVVGTNTVAVTNLDGFFSLDVPSAESYVEVSYLGMQTRKVRVTPPTMVIALELDAQIVSEVVVTGYGVQRRASFTGAAAVVDKDAIEKKSDANFVKALEGAVSGIQMNNSTSMPGTWGEVYVRGRASLNSGTQPLYVIDGVPVNSDYDSMSSSSNNYLDPMASINPNDIESVTVLKDAAATAIYGSRAGNGVIVITTKKGQQGKANINFESKFGVTSMANNNMKFANAEQTMRLFATGYANRYQDGTADEYYDYLKDQVYEWDGVSSYDWMDKVTRNGFYQDYNLNVNGQTGTTNYYVSAGYLDTEGIVIGSDFKRYSGRANFNSKFNFFTVGANAAYTYALKNGFSQSTGGSMSNATVAAISSMTPMDPFYNPDGTYANIDYYNPLALYDEEVGDINEMKSTTLTMSPYLQVDFGKGIYAKTTLGVNIYNLREYQYWSAITNPQGMDYPGLGQQYNSQTSTLTWTNVLGWNYTFAGKHDISLMLGQESQRKDYWYEYYCGDNFPFANAGMRDLSTVGHWNDSEYYKSEARLASYFGDAHYSFDEKYYLSASIRRDGSSVFGADKRWGTFWSVGGKWRFTQEAFFPKSKVLTNGTLRASYGTVGNQDIGWYSARGFYESGANYHGSAGMIPTSISNPNLTWEVSKKFDVGVDLLFFDRVNLAFDYYNEKTTDALFEVPLSRTTGMSSTYQNIGSIRNSGIETTINAVILRNKTIDWTAYANLTYNKNEVLKLSTDLPIEGTYYIIEPGHPYNQFYLKEYAGVDRETGQPLWYKNAEGDETTTNYTQAAKRYVGQANPKVFGGFGTSVKYNGIDASLSFNYRLGGKVYDSGARFTGWGMSGRTPLEVVATDSWTPENTDAKYPQYIYGDPYYGTQASSRFIMSGNFLRLSNVTFGYTLPKDLTKKAYIEKARIYFSADNLYTWTASDFIGYNPETYANGVIAWQYPAVTTFVGGIQITF